MRPFTKICLLICLLGGAFFVIAWSVFAAVSANAQPESDIVQSARVETSSAGLVAKVAPGELFPIAVKLLNFGGGRKVDVTLRYTILTSAGTEIYAGEETVAVETTAHFVKTIQIPFNTAPGAYIAKTSATYGGQLVPATTQFPFTVERRIVGLFQSDFLFYGGSILAAGVGIIILGRSVVRRRVGRRFKPIDYSDLPHDQRVFFELISDIIMEMRERVGDAALDIAAYTEGLVIDGQTGRVLKLTDSPSKIVARLVSGYEQTLGHRVSFAFRSK